MKAKRFLAAMMILVLTAGQVVYAAGEESPAQPAVEGGSLSEESEAVAEETAGAIIDKTAESPVDEGRAEAEKESTGLDTAVEGETETGTGTQEELKEQQMELNQNAESSSDPQQHVQKEYGMAQLDGEVDETPPVIESVKLLQQGQTLRPGDEVTIEVKVTDDVGISFVYITLRTDTYVENVLSAEFDEEKDCYICHYTLAEDIGAKEIHIGWVEAADTSNNYVTYNHLSEGMNWLYWFNIEEGSPFHVETFTMTHDKESIHKDTEISLNVELTEELGSDWQLDAEFEHTSGTVLRASGEPGANKIVFTPEDAEQYGTAKGGYWLLKSITARKEDPDDFNRKKDVEFKGVHYFYLDEVLTFNIQEIKTDKSEINMGETLNIALRTEEGSAQAQEVRLYFYNVTDPSNGEITLSYDETSREYLGKIDTSNMKPGKWYVSSVYVVLENDYTTTEYYSLNTSPCIFYVCDEKGEMSAQDVKIHFYELNQMANFVNYRILKTDVIEGAKLHQTLREAGYELPEPTSAYPGFTWVCWVNDKGNKITENTKIEDIFGEYGAELYALYDKTLVSGFYSYIGENGEPCREEFTEIVDNKGGTLTYEELWQKLESRENPKASYEGLQFQKWKVDNSWGEKSEKDICVSCNDVELRAVYDKHYVTFNYSYPKRERGWGSKSIVKIVEDDSVTYADLVKEASDYQPEDMSSEYGQVTWKPSYYPQGVEQWPVFIKDKVRVTMDAQFSEVELVHIYANYYDDEFDHSGEGMTRQYAWPIKKGEETTVGEVKEEIVKSGLLPKLDTELYKKLEMVGWRPYLKGEEEVVVGGDIIVIEPDYKKCLVILAIDPRPQEAFDGVGLEDPGVFETMILDIVEPGTEYTPPDKIDGYDQIIWWDYMPEWPYKITRDCFFVARGIPSQYLRGDVNEDKSVDIQDLRLVLRYVCGKTQLTERQIQIADVEKNDGKADIQDLRKILRFVCKKIDKL